MVLKTSKVLYIRQILDPARTQYSTLALPDVQSDVHPTDSGTHAHTVQHLGTARRPKCCTFGRFWTSCAHSTALWHCQMSKVPDIGSPGSMELPSQTLLDDQNVRSHSRKLLDDQSGEIWRCKPWKHGVVVSDAP